MTSRLEWRSDSLDVLTKYNMLEMWTKDLVPEQSTDLDAACVAAGLLKLSGGSSEEVDTNHTGDKSGRTLRKYRWCDPPKSENSSDALDFATEHLLKWSASLLKIKFVAFLGRV